MASLVVPLLLVLLQSSMVVYGKTGNGWYFEAKEGLELGPKCHVHHSWSHIIHPYSMTCFQCAAEYTAVIRHGSEAIGAVDLTDCDHQSTTSSVTIVFPSLDEPPEHPPKEIKQLPLVHRIQFDISAEHCVKLVYRRVVDRWVPKEAQCIKTITWWLQIYKLFENGWRPEKMSRDLGVVRKILKVTDNMEEGCVNIRSLKFKIDKFWMRCLDCGKEYRAVISNENIPMAAVDVGSCSNPFLEDSISIVPFRTELRMQYLMVSDQCIMRAYKKVNQVFEESTKPKCLFSDGSRTSKFEYFLVISGYRNGWKTELNEEQKTMEPFNTLFKNGFALLWGKPNVRYQPDASTQAQVSVPPPSVQPPLRTEIVHVYEGVVEVAVMPGDGHCLFSSLLHQLKISSPGLPGHADAVLNLRRRVVQYIRLQLTNEQAIHLPRFHTELWRLQLEDCVESNGRRYPEVDENGLTVSMEDRIQAFLTNLEVDEWGGTETIVAVSHLESVAIVTLFEAARDSHQKIITTPELQALTKEQISVVYRVMTLDDTSSRVDRLHYDSFIKFISPNND